jgi:predicted nucleic acid-binding protein
MAEKEKVYFDSCLFIELIQKKNQERFEACDFLRKSAMDGLLVIVTSTISITETNKRSDSEPLTDDESKSVLAFFQNPYIEMRAVDREVAEFSHELTRKHNLGNMDAIHVATALLNKASVLYTYDGFSDKKKRPGRKGLLAKSLKIGNPPLKILQPSEPIVGPLFDPNIR